MTEILGASDGTYEEMSSALAPNDKLIIESLGSMSILTELGVQDSSQVEVNSGWTRSGETYFTDITIDGPDGPERIIVKACIKLFPIESLTTWLRRREVINSLGIRTPELKAIEPAALAEEFIPYTLREAYSMNDDEGKQRLRDRFIDMYLKVVYAGFNPLGFHDVRSSGSDIVLIDFGEDLGGDMHDKRDLDREKVVAKAEEEFKRIIGS